MQKQPNRTQVNAELHSSNSRFDCVKTIRKCPISDRGLDEGDFVRRKCERLECAAKRSANEGYINFINAIYFHISVGDGWRRGVNEGIFSNFSAEGDHDHQRRSGMDEEKAKRC